MTSPAPKIREIAGAVIFDTSGRLLLQLRDNIPGILYPGKITLFGGHREGDETFLECVVREIHEELSFYIPRNGLCRSRSERGRTRKCRAGLFAPRCWSRGMCRWTRWW